LIRSKNVKNISNRLDLYDICDSMYNDNSKFIKHIKEGIKKTNAGK